MNKIIGYVLAPKRLVDNKLKVRFMYREKPDDVSDSGWRFFSGDENDEYVNNSENIGLYDIETISQIVPDIIPFLSSDIGVVLERNSENEPFHVVAEQEIIKLCLQIAEKAKELLDNKEEKDLVESAIKKCWEWIDNRCNIAEELYHFLDNEENGFTLLQECETDEIIIAAWDCIIDAIAYICKSAYLEAGAEYFPEPIELVDDNMIEHMMKSFSLCSGKEYNP